MRVLFPAVVVAAEAAVEAEVSKANGWVPVLQADLDGAAKALIAFWRDGDAVDPAPFPTSPPHRVIVEE